MGSAVIHKRKTNHHSPPDGRSNSDVVREMKNNIIYLKFVDKSKSISDNQLGVVLNTEENKLK